MRKCRSPALTARLRAPLPDMELDMFAIDVRGDTDTFVNRRITGLMVELDGSAG